MMTRKKKRKRKNRLRQKRKRNNDILIIKKAVPETVFLYAGRLQKNTIYIILKSVLN